MCRFLVCCKQAELKAVKTAMATTEVVDGFEVLHSANVGDTFRLYATITKRLVVMLLLSSYLTLSASIMLLLDVRATSHKLVCRLGGIL